MKHALDKTAEIKEVLKSQKDLLSDMYYTLPLGEGMYINDTKSYLCNAECAIDEVIKAIEKAEGRFEQYFENMKPEGGER